MARAWPPNLGATSIATVGLTAAVVTGADGTIGWRIARVAVLLLATAVAVAKRPNLGAVSGSLVDSGFGIVGTALGFGIGLPWLLDGRPAVASIASIVALPAGLVLLVGAGTATVVKNHRWWRVTVIPWVLVTALLTFSLSVALAATNVAPTPDLAARPSSVGLGAQAVEMTTDDEVTLAGWYVPSSNGAAIVLRHGAGSNRSHLLDHAAVLARHGYGVLLVDARGHGDSGGRAMDLGWYGERDTAAAVDFLRQRPDVEFAKIGVLGLSMGGEEAIGAAGADPRVRAVVAEGATGRTSGDRRWLADADGLRGWIQVQIDRLTFGLTDLLTSAGPPATLERSAVSAAPAPILLIAAGEVRDERRVAERLVATDPDRVELWVVDGAGHTDGLASAPDEWERRVVEFFDRALAVVRDPG